MRIKCEVAKSLPITIIMHILSVWYIYLGFKKRIIFLYRDCLGRVTWLIQYLGGYWFDTGFANMMTITVQSKQTETITDPKT